MRIVHRPTRLTVPLEAGSEEQVAPPPLLTDAPLGGFPIQSLLPVMGAGASVTMMVTLRGNPIMMVVGAVVLMVAIMGGLAMALSQRGNATRTRRTQRERYLDFLENLRTRMRDRSRTVRAAAEALNPAPAALLELARDPGRLWERRRHHSDFLRVRVGVGDRRWFALQIPGEANPVQPYDPIMIAEAETVIEHHSMVRSMPITIDLDQAGIISIIGPREESLGVVRSMILQLASLHSPDDLEMAFAFPESAAHEWAGVDLLPHAQASDLFDGPVAARRVAGSPAGLARVIGGELGDRAQYAATAKRSAGSAGYASNSRLVVIIDSHGHIAESIPIPDAELSLSDLHVTAIYLLDDRLHEPSEVTVRLTILGQDDTGMAAMITDARDEVPTQQRLAVDLTPLTLFVSIARGLAPLRLSLTSRDETEIAAAVGITELLGINDITTLNPATHWRPRSPRDFLRVPIGVDDFGAPVLLDLKESAQLGMGPHGICIGATGSGKSEMLRTLILGLALSHPPEDLSMVLVDYKGGAAFAPFAGLPHVAGIIDNLADDAQLTERARASIAGEVVRRQEQLRDADSSPSISHYRQLRTTRPDLPPMPHLFVVIDEFGELLTAEPDFVDLLLTIGRIGRSIGVHLLLSSQRIEAGKLRGLDTYLSYRIGLRTFSESESSVVLDTPDAFHLPAIPGYGYLKVDTSVYRRFRAGYVSGPLPSEMARSLEPNEERTEALLLPVYNTIAGEPSAETEVELRRPSVGRALIDEAVDQLRGGAPTTAPVWLDPLPARFGLDRVLPRDIGLDHASQATRPLRVAMGLLDDPTRQRQDPWILDLTRSGGNIAVMGAPQSGRTTFLRTFAASVALTHTPQQVTLYGMDLTGGGLLRLEGFPHVGGVATRAHPDRLRRLLEELHAMLATRETVFRDLSIDSLAALRTRHAAGEIPQLVSADVVLLLDGVGTLRSDFEDLEGMLADLVLRGGSFGIHVVLAMTRWNELKLNLQSVIGTRLELHLNDPSDSGIGKKLSEMIRSGQPGRILTDDSLFAQVSLPVLEDTDDESIGAQLELLAQRSAQSWSGPAAAAIRLLPDDLSPDELPDPFGEPDTLPFGLRQDTMDPVSLDLLGRDQHLLIFGDARSGKTTLLRGLAQAMVARWTPEELVLAVMDVRGEVASEIPDSYLGAHASNSKTARGLADAVADVLAERQDSDPTHGPRIVVLADDYDILAAGGTDPLAPLLPYLSSARDLRLHVLLTRPVAGSTRAMYDLVLQSIRDTSGTSLVMSGERSEGQVVPQVYAEQMVAGRGRFVRRGERPRLVQVANFRAVDNPQKPSEKSTSHAL
ncbi:MAG: type VII secretion protein EccCa [Rhodoglobus sp.]